MYIETATLRNEWQPVKVFDSDHFARGKRIRAFYENPPPPPQIL
jgi:hypothetical protein